LRKSPLGSSQTAGTALVKETLAIVQGYKLVFMRLDMNSDWSVNLVVITCFIQIYDLIYPTVESAHTSDEPDLLTSLPRKNEAASKTQLIVPSI